ncbi:MAG: carbohydrate ABC transporter permease [bacterium]|nr:carbohydrate ABC transporter permease [bacterium]
MAATAKPNPAPRTAKNSGRFFESRNPFKPSPVWRIISYALLGLWSIVVLFPLYWLLITAFKQPIDVQAGPRYLPFIDFQPTLQTWNELLVEQGIFVIRPYLNTIVVGLISAVCALIIGTAASYALNRFEYRPKPGLILSFIGCVVLMVICIGAGLPPFAAIVIGLAVYALIAQTIGKRFKAGGFNNSDIAFWLVSQRMLPPIAVIIPIYVMFQQAGLLNTHAGLIIAYTAVNLPLVIWFMRDYFASIPVELEESAFIDGASRYTVLRRIVLPLALPGLIATFLIVLVFAWNEYTLALFLTGAETQTMPLLVAAQNATRGPQWWNISVLVTLMVTPIVIMAIILERYIAKGILVGAVKG